jgi:hypothetical protein
VAGHRALQLIDVADEVALSAVERLLELLELCPPALDPILAERDVGLELRLADLEFALPLAQLEHPGVDQLLGDRRIDRRAVGGAQDGRERCRLLRRYLDSQDEGLGGAEFVVRHEEPHEENRPGRPAALSLA